MRKFNSKHVALAFTLAAATLVTATFVAGDDGSTDRNNQFDFALIGDTPYFPVTTLTGGQTVQTYTPPPPAYSALIADVNRRNKVLFTVHVGDIKMGNSWCVGGIDGKDPVGAENVYTNNLALFNSFRTAAVYIPGDNEWTDCHRTTNGAYDPTERLGYLRSVFYTTNQSLGQRPITLTRQSDYTDIPTWSKYKENVTWRTGNIIFVAINQPGSNNNHQRNTGSSSPKPTDDNEAEYTARNTANIAWITKAFNDAEADAGTKAVVILQQANPFERFLETGQGYLHSGYEDFINTLRTRTVAFGKPVVMVGGDTHTIRIDKPLTTLYPGHTPPLPPTIPPTPDPIQPATAGNRIANFTRVEVFGPPTLGPADSYWVRAIVDPSDPNVFSFSTQTIPGN